MAHVADNADDRQPFDVRLARIVEGDALADGFLVRKPFLRERVVHDDDAGAFKLIAVVEEAPLQERHLAARKNIPA